MRGAERNGFDSRRSGGAEDLGTALADISPIRSRWTTGERSGASSGTLL